MNRLCSRKLIGGIATLLVIAATVLLAPITGVPESVIVKALVAEFSIGAAMTGAQGLIDYRRG